jgi:poly-gamma-glutamate synthesis protein (capsule biosynthesis protein)
MREGSERRRVIRSAPTAAAAAVLPTFFLMFLPMLAGGCRPLSVAFPGPESPVELDLSALPAGIVPVRDGLPADRAVAASTLRSARQPDYAAAREYSVRAVPWPGSAEGPVRVIPLEQAVLPEKILPADGLYPGDEGYPLTDWVILEVRPQDGGGERKGRRAERLDSRLETWLEGEAARLLETDRALRPEPRFFRIAAVGDIMPGRGFGELLLGDGGVEETLGDVAPLLAAPDLLIGNLETAVTDSEGAVPKSYNFRVSPEVLRAVTALGFDFYHLANNHGWDYGEKGFLDTLTSLRAVGAGFSGAGETLQAARFAWETRTPAGETIRILSLGAYFTERNGFDGRTAAAAGPGKPGVLWDSAENEDFIRGVLSRDDAFTVVTVHGGYEWEDLPRQDVKDRYRRYVDWGADLVLAHHPHVLQELELYRGAPIAYSLGNFIFPGMTGWYSGEETGILEFLLYGGRIVGADFRPVRISGPRLRRAEGEGIEGRLRGSAAEPES